MAAVSLDRAFDSPETKRQHNRALFTTIADRYDLITRILSYGQDARWKRRLIALADVRQGDRVLDLATGTGDVAFAAASAGANVVGLDLTHRMLQLARLRQGYAGQAGARCIEFINADMGNLPLSSASFDLVTTSYGLRNVPDLDSAIDEIARVLKPGGRLVSLDFNRPDNQVIRSAYLVYLSCVGSVLGWVLHRDPDTYRYIPESLKRYPGARGIAERIASRGFDQVRIVPVLFGLMSIHVVRRSVR